MHDFNPPCVMLIATFYRSKCYTFLECFSVTHLRPSIISNPGASRPRRLFYP